MEDKRKPTAECIAALDIGSTKITLAVCPVNDSCEKERVIYLGSVDSKGIANYTVSNQSDVVACIRSLVSRMERELEHTIDHVHVAYMGGRIECKPYQAKVGCKTVEDKSTNTIISEADLKRLEEESEKYLQGNTHLIFDKEPVQYLADGERITSSVVNTYARECACDYNLFIAEQRAHDRLRRAMENAGLAVDSMRLGVRGCVEATTDLRQRQQGIAVLDIGTTRSQLVVYMGDRIQHYAWLPVGGKHITDDIAQGRAIDHREAEIQKIQAGRKLESCIDRIIEGNDDGMTENGMPSVEYIIYARILDFVNLIMQKFAEWNIGCRLGVNGLLLTGGGACFDGMHTIFEKLMATKTVGPRMSVNLGISTIYKCKCITDTSDQAALLRGATAIGLVHAAEEMRQRAIDQGSAPRHRPQEVHVESQEPDHDQEAEDTSLLGRFLGRIAKSIGGVSLKDEPGFEEPSK